MLKKLDWSKINRLVDAVYVLSVKKLDDRISHIQSELSRHNIDFKFVFEYDADNLTGSDLSIFLDDAKMIIQHKSLVLKNIHVWKESLKNNFSRVLIFEDDIFLKPDFLSRFESAINDSERFCDSWLIFLGGSDVKMPLRFYINPALLIQHPISTAEATVINQATIKKRLLWLENNKINLPADHLIRKIDDETGTPHYWLKQAIVEQGSTNGKFSSLLDSHRQKHSQLFTICRNRWNKFRRRTLRKNIAKALFKVGLLKP